MRSRSNSGVRLDFYQRVVQRTILRHQNPVTGLLPATPEHPHAWTRDNVYSILAVWGLALAYRKTADLDEDRAKAYELEQSVVKLMRGLLQCMMKQIKKVEQFKYSQSPTDALHAKYSVSTGETVVTDSGWGHLQIDAISLYLLILAEMTASGLQIIFTQDEVAFVQNLVFYIQAAYRIPDYGIWERGDKTNHGLPELNASSIGMAKAAMEAINELDLFGARGGPSSIIHVMADEAQQCQAILHSMLPRESVSKEVDAGLLSVIGYPGFAVNDPELIEFTRDTIIEKLEGKYGLCRFLRDGHKTAKEDPNRLHYEPWELQVFEGIECEWPMFFSYLILEGIFRGDQNQVDYYSDKLEPLLIKDEHGMKLVPEMFAVPADKVETEYKHPQSTARVAVGKLPQTWGQSLYILGRLLKEGFLSPGELDPLNRRLVTEPKPDLVVQVVILAEDRSIQEKLAYHDLKVQTIAEVNPIQVYPARVLSQIYAFLGRSKKLELSGRPSDMVGILATSRLYSIGDKIMAFMPQFIDQIHFYLSLDTALLLDMFKTDCAYLHNSWNMLGRPLLVLSLGSSMIDHMHALHPSLVATIRKLQTGYIAGTRVQLGNLGDFLNTSCVTNLTFLMESDEPDEVGTLLASLKGGLTHHSRGVLGRSASRGSRSSGARIRRRNSVKGIIRRTCSIQIEAGEIPDFSYSSRSSSAASLHSLDLSHLLPKTCSMTSSMLDSNETTPMSSLPTSPTPFLKGDSASPSFHFIGQHPHLRGEDETEGSVTQYHDEQFEGIDCDDLLEQLKEVESLHEQADILHFLFIAKGPDWESYMGGKPVRVRDLLSELYEKAGHLKQWWLVRHTAGMLRKQVEGLAKSATDILVRQKQLAVGLPPEPREKIITAPLPPDELAAIIDEACGEDTSTAMLTQELLVYLAMFIKTEPKLFNEMLRLRVGLIIQVMASELARTLKCTGEVASDQLLNLSPYEMKTLLHHILSGKEFGVQSVHSQYSSSGRSLSIIGKDSSNRLSQHQSPYTSGIGLDLYGSELKGIDAVGAFPIERSDVDKLQESMETDRQGQWLRRRRLDGSLNRVPIHFYGQIWNVLGRCHGLRIANYELPNSLTREMTPGELKFALQVEMALNRIPQPEYRQLMVEAMMVLCLVVEHDNGKTRWHELVHVDKIVSKANEIFVYEQTQMEGDVTLCCGNPNHSNQHGQLKCGGAANICQHFYDSAPSGRYGTMTYMCKAVARFLPFPMSHDGNLDCVVS